MPAHYQAVFDPIPPNFDLTALVTETPNFHWVERIKLVDVINMGKIEFEKLVAIQVIHGGKPLIVEGWNAELPPWLYSTDWLKTNVGKKVEVVRDISNETNHEMTIGHYLDNMGKLTESMTAAKYHDQRRQRLYLKDIDCPAQWREQLARMFPKFLFYMNESVAEKGEPGSTTYKDEIGQELQTQCIAPAGDLMSNLPPEMRAENLQLYIGHEGTYTPAHKEMCGTSSQNIMVETSSNLEDGERSGSSIWFMTESQDREVVSEYFLSVLGHDIEIEKHFAQIVAWKKAPFPVFVVEQKVGDLVLVPPLAPHQVWNRGKRTIKVAWNRTTVETLEFALRESLPKARMVCRDEQYRIKATVYYSLIKYYGRLRDADKIDEEKEFSHPIVHEKVWDSFRVQMLKEDFTRLAKLFADIMVDEIFSPDLPKVKDVEYLPFEGNVTCSYCRCNIFNRFLTCKSCKEELVNGDEDTYDVCMDCYVMGRSCACMSNLSWVEQWKWLELANKYDEYKDLVNFITQDPARWLLPLAEERKKRGKKTTAEVCQEQLLRRPWNDVKNPDTAKNSHIGSVPEGEKSKKRIGGKRRKPKTQEALSTKPCHICKKPDKPWKLAECTTCDAAYCYGSLWGAFDLMPEDIMKDPSWQCPDCLDICSCVSCQRKHPHRAFYEPKGTLLGHDTKAVADPRSVESLVDFSKSNNLWLRDNDTNPRKTKRMRKLIEAAKAKKIEYYRYAAQQWGMDSDAYVPEVLQGYQSYDKEKEKTASDRNTPVLTPSRIGMEGSVAASDSGSGMHKRTLSPSFDNAVPIEPMGSIAPSPPFFIKSGYNISDPYPSQNDSSSKFQTQTVNGNSSFVNPNELMNEPCLSNTDALTSGLPEDEAHLANAPHNADLEDDPILFQHSGAWADSPLSTSAHPRLPHETPDDDHLTAGQEKRKRQSILVDGDMNEAHKEFILIEQHKKLANAKKKGRSYYTQSQILGEHLYIVKLRVPNKKAELAAMADSDAGRAGIRHNPREARRGVASRDSVGGLDLDIVGLDDEGGGEDMVISDVRPRRVQETEPAQLPHSEVKKKRRRMSSMSLPSLEPDAVLYEATVKGSVKRGHGRPRKSRGEPAERGEEGDDDPFEGRYSSPKRKKSIASRPSISAGRARVRPRKETQKKAEAVTMKISGSQRNFDDELITPKKSIRLLQPDQVEHHGLSPDPASAPASVKKSRKSAAASLQFIEPSMSPTHSMSGSKRRQAMEPEYDYTKLQRTKRSKQGGMNRSTSIIDGGVDGSVSSVENHWVDQGDNYSQKYMSHNARPDDDTFHAPINQPSGQTRWGPTGSDTMHGGSDNIMTGLFDDEDDLGGKPITIPMADDDEDFAAPISPAKREASVFTFDDEEESDDAAAAPSPSKQINFEMVAQRAREQIERQQSARQTTVESMAHPCKAEYCIADLTPGSFPEAAHRNAPPRPSRPSSINRGYHLGSYSPPETAVEKLPSARASENEDGDLHPKLFPLRELEEEQECERREAERAEQAKFDAEKARLGAIPKANSDTEAAKAEEPRLAKPLKTRGEIAQGKAREDAEEKGEGKAVKAKKKVVSNFRAEGKAYSSAVPSDDSALEDNNDDDEDTDDSDIDNNSVEAPEEKFMSMAEKRALSGKTGAFKVIARSSKLVVLPGLTSQRKKRYSVSNASADEEEGMNRRTPARNKRERSSRKSSSTVVVTPGNVKRGSASRR